MKTLIKVYVRFEKWIFVTNSFIVGKKRNLLRRLFGDKTIIEVDDNFDSSNSSVAIIGIYPQRHNVYQHSIKNLLDGLKSNGIQIIVVSNAELNQELTDLFRKYQSSVILRKNQGRDFGAYQSGLLWLRDQGYLAQVKRLLFINDTLIWLKSSIEVVKETCEHDWQSIYLNLERNVHAHSFYLSFSERVVQSQRFLDFWDDYLPQDSRNHAIHNGENQLSNILIAEGFSCKPLVTPEFVKSGLIRVKRSKSLTVKVFSTPISGLYPGNPPQTGRERRVFRNIEVNTFFDQLASFAYSDAPHRLGLTLHLTSNLPLKADLFKFYAISEILSVAHDAVARELLSDFYLVKSQKFQVSDRATKRLRRLGEI